MSSARETAERIAHEYSGCWGGTGVNPHTIDCGNLRDAITAAILAERDRVLEALNSMKGD
jgi:predicted metalloprotease